MECFLAGSQKKMVPEKKRTAKIIDQFILTALIFLFLSTTIISIIYIKSPSRSFPLDSFYVGLLGWTTLGVSTIYMSRNFFRESRILFAAFFILAFKTQAYLEPMSDQIDHLYRSYEKCENIDRGGRFNKGLWQYSMNSIFICDTRSINSSPEDVLFRVDILHAFYISFGCLILFIIGKESGLPAKWSLFSVFLALFFMGTNKFSYFRYYSYGPSFTSIIAYWSWIAFYLFKKDMKSFLLGISSGLLITISLSINHLQEACFLLFIIFFYIIINLINFISKKYALLTSRAIILSFLLILFFIVPQTSWFSDLFNHLSIKNYFNENKKYIFFLGDYHLCGNIFDKSLRVSESLGTLGYLGAIISALLIFIIKTEKDRIAIIKISVIGSLAFLIFLTPLCNYIWINNVKISVYYRAAYSSLFWLPITWFLYIIEMKVNEIKT